jgi:hypothetical protein
MFFYLLLIMLSTFLSSSAMERKEAQSFISRPRLISDEDMENSKYKSWSDKALYEKIQEIKNKKQLRIGRNQQKNKNVLKEFDSEVAPYQIELFSRCKPYIPKVDWNTKNSLVAYAEYALFGNEESSSENEKKSLVSGKNLAAAIIKKDTNQTDESQKQKDATAWTLQPVTVEDLMNRKYEKASDAWLYEKIQETKDILAYVRDRYKISDELIHQKFFGYIAPLQKELFFRNRPYMLTADWRKNLSKVEYEPLEGTKK